MARTEHERTMLTHNVELEEISQRDVWEGDFKAVGGDKGLVKAAHDVDLSPLRQLLFAPDHREVEQRVGWTAERTLQTGWASLVHHVILGVRQQGHVVIAAACCQYKQ